MSSTSQHPILQPTVSGIIQLPQGLEVTEDQLSSQIMGLKKAAAANRNTTSKDGKGKKKGPVGTGAEKSMLLERTTFDDSNGGARNANSDDPLIDGQQNQMGTRSNSQGRLALSQQPRQGSRQSKHRKSTQGSNSIKNDSDTPVHRRENYANNPTATANILLNNSLNTQNNVSRVQGAGHHFLNMSHATAPTHYLNYPDESSSFMDGPINNSNLMNDYNLQALIEQKRSKGGTRVKDLQKQISVQQQQQPSSNEVRPLGSASGNKRSQSTTRGSGGNQQLNMMVGQEAARQSSTKRLESGTTRKSNQQVQQYYDPIMNQQQRQSAVVNSQQLQNLGGLANFFKHQAVPHKQLNAYAQQQSGRKSSSTGRSGMNNSGSKNAKRSASTNQGIGIGQNQLQQTSNNILGIVAQQQQQMRYQSNNNLRSSNAELGNSSFYQSNTGVNLQMQQQPKSSSDLYKVYLNYQPPVGVSGGATMNSQPTPNQQQIQYQLASSQPQDLIMVSRHNNLVAKNKKALQSQLQLLNNASGTNPVNLSDNAGSLPKISNQTPLTNAAANGGIQQHSPSSNAPYSSLKQNTMLNASKSGLTTSKPLTQGQKQMSTTMVNQQQTQYKNHPMMNPSATAQVPTNFHQYNHTSNSLDQYGQGLASVVNNHQFASINQSMLIRNLNYSILQGELEHEAALEDMHMFFVAFNKRQKKIVEGLEVRPGSVNSPRLNKILDDSPSKGTTAEHKSPLGNIKEGINVLNFDEEIDLE